MKRGSAGRILEAPGRQKETKNENERGVGVVCML